MVYLRRKEKEKKGGKGKKGRKRERKKRGTKPPIRFLYSASWSGSTVVIRVEDKDQEGEKTHALRTSVLRVGRWGNVGIRHGSNRLAAQLSSAKRHHSRKETTTLAQKAQGLDMSIVLNRQVFICPALCTPHPASHDQTYKRHAGKPARIRMSRDKQRYLMSISSRSKQTPARSGSFFQSERASCPTTQRNRPCTIST